MRKYPINITLDTNIFFAAKYDLSKDSSLRALSKLVNDGKVRVYLSSIVIQEAYSDLDEIGQSVCSKIRDNRKQLLKTLDENAIKIAGLENYLDIPDNKLVKKKIRDRFDEYIKSLKPNYFDINSINFEQIIDDYFSYTPPFEKSGNKRKEFPDAFISDQIRRKFPNGNITILSTDNGFIKSCQRDYEYEIFSTIGELCNEISKQDESYNKVIETIKDISNDINKEIKEAIASNGNIIVWGHSIDRKGEVSGYDYSDTILNSVNNITHEIHVVEDIDEENAIVILNCKADIIMDCYYDDYDDALWDSEEKEYIFVDAIHIVETHKAIFPVRVHIDYQNKTLFINNISIRLGSNSRIDRRIVDRKRMWEKPYTICPACGIGISSINDGGNGFCINCAPDN